MKNNVNKKNQTFFKSFSTLLLVLIVSLTAANLLAEETKTEKKASTKEEHIKNLKSGNKEAKIEALQFIAKEKIKEAVTQVGETLALKSNDREVRAEAAATLGVLEDKEKAFPFLENAIKNDNDALVQYAAILSIVNLGDKRAAAVLEHAHRTNTDPDIKDITQRLMKKFK